MNFADSKAQNKQHLMKKNGIIDSTARYWLCFSLIAEKAITARITAPAIIR